MLSPVRMLLAVAVAAFCLTYVPDCPAAEEPSLGIVGSEHVVKLTKEQKDAIKSFDPSFQVRREADYLPSLVKDYVFTNRQLPFAVIGDFNGDGTMDVVLQGYNKTSELVIAVLSAKGGGPIVMEVVRSRLVDPKTELYTVGEQNEYGLWTYLTFVPKGNVDSAFAARPLKLSTDAFQLNYFEKASVLYYLSGYQFMKYVTSD